MPKTRAVITPERLRVLPDSPGVYLMKDAEGAVLYIGKAKDLRARVRSYFSGGDERFAVQFLLERIHKVETIVTVDERQALVLEGDLIRKYRPRYNIRLKDDRAYLLVRIDHRQEWPRIELVRQEKSDAALYLGPYPFGYELKSMLELIQRAVPLRTCSDHVLRNRVRPCIEYQIKRCAAPCCLAVDRARYTEWIEQAVRMLQGCDKEVLSELEAEMYRASEELRYEDAALLRDRLEVARKFRSDRNEVRYGTGSMDAFGLYREAQRVEIALLMVRRGRLFESKSFGFSAAAGEDEEVIASVISQYYGEGAEVPEEILLAYVLEDSQVREEILSEKRGTKVLLCNPLKGPKARLLNLAVVNATENFRTRFHALDVGDAIARGLQEELLLEEPPRTVECVDISHFQGGSTVGSVVCFTDGKPDKARYRHFILSQEGKPDDFASMREIVLRHLSRCAEENTLADLLVIDGGGGQLAQALSARRELGLETPTIVALAKKRSEKKEYLTFARTLRRFRERKPERVYKSELESPLILPPQSETLNLLERVRDEAHRFAISFHRVRRKKKLFTSALDDIQGLGPRRRQQLLREFGSLRALREAEPGEISIRCKISLPLAKRLVAVLRRKTGLSRG